MAMNPTRAGLVLLGFAVLLPWAPAQMEPDLPKRINAAIDKGVVWLKARQIQQGEEKGSWGTGDNPLYGGGGGVAHKDIIGITALALLTLEKCDVDPEDPVVVAGWDFIDKHLDKGFETDPTKVDHGKEQLSSYEIGVLLMAIEALYDGRFDKAVRAAKKDPKKVKRQPIQLEKRHDMLVKAMVRWAKAEQTPVGGWRYGEPIFPSPEGIGQDVSATQVVLLGLVSAVRMGVPVDPQLFLKAAQFNLDAQEKDGPPAKAAILPGSAGKTVAIKEGDKARGWAYVVGGSDEHEKKVSGSMTASGICSLILAKSELGKGKVANKDLLAKIDRGIFDGLAWLDMNYTVESNPGGFRSHYYYLYGLERVGVLGGIDAIGLHNWYIDGAEHLVKAQKPDGKWYTKTEVEPGDVIDTCFALLFLKKATMPVGVVLSR